MYENLLYKKIKSSEIKLKKWWETKRNWKDYKNYVLRTKKKMKNEKKKKYKWKYLFIEKKNNFK